MIKHDVCDDVFINENLMICDAMMYVFVHDDYIDVVNKCFRFVNA